VLQKLAFKIKLFWLRKRVLKERFVGANRLLVEANQLTGLGLIDLQAKRLISFLIIPSKYYLFCTNILYCKLSLTFNLVIKLVVVIPSSQGLYEMVRWFTNIFWSGLFKVSLIEYLEVMPIYGI